MLKYEISDDKRHQRNTSYMTKAIGNVFGVLIAFAFTLAATFAIYSISITTTFLISFLKFLINIFPCYKVIPSPSSRNATFFCCPTKPVQYRYHVQPDCNITLSHFAPKYMYKNSALPQCSKRTLFLGLSRVLVSFTIDQPSDQYDLVVHPIIKGKRRACYVVKRPGLDELLCAAKNASVEVVVYTSRCREYAGPIIDALDPTKMLITHRLYQDACTNGTKGPLMKDLVLTGRELDRCIIIDDNPKLHVKQWENAIVVSPFLGDHADTDLINLTKLFEMKRNFNDFWQLIKLETMGIISLRTKDSTEFGIEAYRLSSLKSLNLSTSVTTYAYQQLCLDFKSLPPPIEQIVNFIAPLKKRPFNHISDYLVKITLKDSKLPENTIQVFQGLPNLNALSLIINYSYNGKDLKFPESSFTKLELLSFEDQVNMNSLIFEENCLPELKELNVISSNFDFAVTGIGNLHKLKKIQVHCGEEESEEQK